MPRDSNGDYTFPVGSGNPVTPNTPILADWANPTMEDIQAALTDSLSRSGQGGMTGPFPLVSGSITVPGLTWSDEPTMGLYRPTDGTMSWTIGGVDVSTLNADSLTVLGRIYGEDAAIIQSTTGAPVDGGGFWIQGDNLGGDGYIKMQASNGLAMVIPSNTSGLNNYQVSTTADTHTWFVKSADVMLLRDTGLEVVGRVVVEGNGGTTGILLTDTGLKKSRVHWNGDYAQLTSTNDDVNYMVYSQNPSLQRHGWSIGNVAAMELTPTELNVPAGRVVVEGNGGTTGILLTDVGLKKSRLHWNGDYAQLTSTDDDTNYMVYSQNSVLQRHGWAIDNVERMELTPTKLTLSGNLNVPNMPTSAAGLSSGDLWNNNGVVNIV